MSTDSSSLSWFTRNERRIQWSFLVVFLGLLIWSVLDALGWLPGERGYRPEQMILLSAALLAQAIGSLIRRRSMIASYALMATSLALLIWGFADEQPG